MFDISWRSQNDLGPLAGGSAEAMLSAHLVASTEGREHDCGLPEDLVLDEDDDPLVCRFLVPGGLQLRVCYLLFALQG